MTLRKILALTCLLLPMMASAHQFETGQRVPPIGITDRGELVLDKDQFSYKTWNSAQLVGTLESNPQLSFATRMEDWTCLGKHKRQPEFPVVTRESHRNSRKTTWLPLIAR